MNMAQMRCAELVEAGKPLVLKEKPIPDAPPKGLVIKTSFGGVCHTDIHLQDDKIPLGGDKVMKFTDTPTYKFPQVLGHEISGVVHSLGSEANADGEELKVGDKVLVYPWLGCCSPDCGLCRNGETNTCSVWTNALGLGAPGGYGSYISVPERRFALKLPENIPMDTAALMTCSGLTSYCAIKLAKPTIDMFVTCNGRASLLIIGAGGLGLWCIQLAKAVLHNTTVVVADISEEKLEVAKKHGADKTVLWNSDDEAEIEKRTRAAGDDNEIHAAIDLVNMPVTASRGNDCLAKGGALVCVGLFGGGMDLCLPLLPLRGRKILGCYVGSLPSMKELIQLVSEKQVNPPPKEYVKLDDINDTLDRLRARKIAGRCIIRYD
ncbi:alcohol dehydrogenase-like [Liolophura sinensis]|uniref:alcohol dehydrogenase-like n=1 Tax=Liolophura sinensis TaxID=3198878 RepID=UPI003157F82F